jgi:hypothetical protein
MPVLADNTRAAQRFVSTMRHSFKGSDKPLQGLGCHPAALALLSLSRAALCCLRIERRTVPWGPTGQPGTGAT